VVGKSPEAGLARKRNARKSSELKHLFAQADVFVDDTNQKIIKEWGNLPLPSVG